MSLTRQLGLGRFAYRLFHAPLGKIRETIAAGGPLEQRRTSRGRTAMEQAARTTLPPITPPPADAPAAPVHVLTGRALWFQTAFMLHSLARFQPVRVCVHNDGTLGSAQREALSRVVPWAEFVPTTETEAQIDRLLPEVRFPTLRRRRTELVLFRKIIDVHLGRAGWRLFLDSDMLFFRRPTMVCDWLREPRHAIHMVDAVRSYGYELTLLAKLAGRVVPDLVNTGMLGLRSDTLDWERLEWWCRKLIESAGTHYLQEQALMALCLSETPHAALPRTDYLVLPDETEAHKCRAILHHYVARSKRYYFRENWQIVHP